MATSQSSSSSNPSNPQATSPFGEDIRNRSVGVEENPITAGVVVDYGVKSLVAVAAGCLIYKTFAGGDKGPTTPSA
jgi:hypothetical protein